VLVAVCMALEIDKYVRNCEEPENLSLLTERTSKNWLDKIEDIKYSEIIYPVACVIVASLIALVPLTLNAYGNSGFVWCWIAYKQDRNKRIFLMVCTLYGWVPLSWFFIIHLSGRILRYQHRRYLILLGVFIAVWIPRSIQRMIGLFVAPPFWLHFLHIFCSHMKGILNFTVVVVILYGEKITDGFVRLVNKRVN